MNMLLIGGGVYAAALFYALALCKVAGDADRAAEADALQARSSSLA